MKPHTITIELPTSSASAPLMLAEIQALVAQLAIKHGCKVETDKRLMGWVYTFVQRFVPNTTVVPLFKAMRLPNHTPPPSAA